jgi:hypothetical protein
LFDVVARAARKICICTGIERAGLAKRRRLDIRGIIIASGEATKSGPGGRRSSFRQPDDLTTLDCSALLAMTGLLTWEFL